MNYDAGAPLGGTPPVPEQRPQRSDRRDLVLTAVLLVAAVVAGATSLMPWRDYGRRFGATVSETGWLRPDGSMGRGWWFVLLGVALAVAGVLIAGGRRRPGRILASATGAVMAMSAILEWGLGDGGARSGPGPGLWVELVVGVLVVVAVGVLEPRAPADRAAASP